MLDLDCFITCMCGSICVLEASLWMLISPCMIEILVFFLEFYMPRDDWNWCSGDFPWNGGGLLRLDSENWTRTYGQLVNQPSRLLEAISGKKDSYSCFNKEASTRRQEPSTRWRCHSKNSHLSDRALTSQRQHPSTSRQCASTHRQPVQFQTKGSFFLSQTTTQKNVDPRDPTTNRSWLNHLIEKGKAMDHVVSSKLNT